MLDWLSRAAALIPPVAVCVCVGMFGHDLPIMDEWDFLLPLLQKSYESGVTFSDFLVQQNEHWIVFPLFVMAPVAWLTQWDLRWELWGTVILALTLFGLLARSMTLGFRQTGERPKPWLLPLWSLLYFSLSQWQTWLYPMHMFLMFSMLFALGSLVVLAHGNGGLRWTILAAACGFVASFSHGACVAVWPAGMLVLYLRTRDRNVFLRHALLWSVTTIVATAILIGASRVTPAARGIVAALWHPVALVRYIFTWLGSPLFTMKPSSAMLAGVLGTLAALTLCRELQRRGAFRETRLALLPGLIAFSVGAAGIVALGRYFDSPDQALSSRYITFATPFWLGITAVVSLLWPKAERHAEPPRMRRAAFAFVIAAFALAGAASVRGAYLSDERYDGFAEARQAFIEGKNSGLLERLHPLRERVVEGRDVMRKHRLSVFRDTQEFESNGQP